MKKNLLRVSVAHVFVALMTVLLGCAPIAAQTESGSRYIISAKAGKINALYGKAAVQRQGDSTRRELSLKDDLESGDVLMTESNGRVELLLNPGSYLRVAENSQVELTDTSFDNLRFKLLRGSVIVEATGTDGTRLLAAIYTPQTKILVDRNGLYRINVLPAQATEVFVHKGKALVGSSTLAVVKGGSKMVVQGVNAGGVDVAKFDKKSTDAFADWSRQRAGALAAANRSLTGRTMTNVLASYRDNGAFGYGQAPYFGLWVFDPSLRGYTFLPFYSGWSSPYGVGYRNGFGISWYYNTPNQPGSYSIANPGNGGSGNNIIVANPNPPVASGEPPPHRRLPRDPDDPDAPIGGKPMRPMPVENGDRFERAMGGRSEGIAPDSGGFNQRNNSPSPAQEQGIEVNRPSAPAREPAPERPGRIDMP
ncbi:MAG: FecR domain-containing protein [Pyrinomonadaceae bacterium]